MSKTRYTSARARGLHRNGIIAIVIAVAAGGFVSMSIVGVGGLGKLQPFQLAFFAGIVAVAVLAISALLWAAGKENKHRAAQARRPALPCPPPGDCLTLDDEDQAAYAPIPPRVDVNPVPMFVAAEVQPAPAEPTRYPAYPPSPPAYQPDPAAGGGNRPLPAPQPIPAIEPASAQQAPVGA